MNSTTGVWDVTHCVALEDHLEILSFIQFVLSGLHHRMRRLVRLIFLIEATGFGLRLDTKDSKG